MSRPDRVPPWLPLNYEQCFGVDVEGDEADCDDPLDCLTTLEPDDADAMFLSDAYETAVDMLWSCKNEDSRDIGCR